MTSTTVGGLNRFVAARDDDDGAAFDCAVARRAHCSPGAASRGDDVAHYVIDTPQPIAGRRRRRGRGVRRAPSSFFPFGIRAPSALCREFPRQRAAHGGQSVET